ncbi:MAG: M20/M25/M40 family metallo-hydrolase [Acidobacteria bacterium]|nr:M20/M25/M40 family metallo-hydrolase [Acidobacteriota bacterium]MBI3656140.1 M20/M25/M40 family metallo-hydrolase [Acidobacteriota bacterium]
MNKAIQYADQHFDKFVEELKSLARIPSVSFPGFPPEEVQRSAQAVAALLTAAGFDHVEVLRVGDAHPYVYGDWLHAPDAPTVLLYAHHDVQPPGRAELWKSPPFEPTKREGRLFGRGTADDKAGIIVHTSAVVSYLRSTGKLPVNVKVVIEGEEEIGSEHLEHFLQVYQNKLQGDLIVLTDTANFDVGIPSITTSLRGISAVEVEVHVMDHPVHSGMWGGPSPDPVLALAKMLDSLIDASGRITIPGIYDDVRPLLPVERASLASLEYGEKEFREQAQLLPGVQFIGGDASVLEKLWRLPALSVNAIEASHRKTVANIINESAWAKVGIRTVPDMDPIKTIKRLTDHLKAHAPWGVEVKIISEQAGSWWITKPEGPAFEAAHAAMTKGFGREAVYIGAGGSIPFVGPFANVLGGAPALLIGVEDPYTNAHSENESLHLGDFKKSIAGAIYLYEELAARYKR